MQSLVAFTEIKLIGYLTVTLALREPRSVYKFLGFSYLPYVCRGVEDSEKNLG